MGLRIRQVKPDYWRDSRLADLTDTERLIYIGLWMEADDAGWFREDIPEIATDLFPYVPRDDRERTVSTVVSRLRGMGRLVSHPCGHTFIPTMTKHQRLSSTTKRVLTVEREHGDCGGPGDARGEPRDTAGTRASPPGKERDGTVVGKGTDMAPAPFGDDGSEYPVIAWLAQQGVSINPNGNGFHRRVVVMVGRYGPEKVRAAMTAAMAEGARGDRAIVFGAENLLDPPPNGRPRTEAKGAVSTEEAERAFRP